VRVSSFFEIEAEFIQRVHTMVWCSVATADTKDRIRSRILHPIWEGSTGWAGSRRNSLKARHIARNPYVSLAYVSDIAKPAYADCLAEWEDGLAAKQRVWNLFLSAPPPLGFDYANIFKSPEDPEFGVLKLIPWRIELFDIAAVDRQRVWLAPV
jgi:hypothetical protein